MVLTQVNCAVPLATAPVVCVGELLALASKLPVPVTEYTFSAEYQRISVTVAVTGVSVCEASGDVDVNEIYCWLARDVASCANCIVFASTTCTK